MNCAHDFFSALCTCHILNWFSIFKHSSTKPKKKCCVLWLKLSIYKVLPFLQMFVANVPVNVKYHLPCVRMYLNRKKKSINCKFMWHGTAHPWFKTPGLEMSQRCLLEVRGVSGELQWKLTCLISAATARRRLTWQQATSLRRLQTLQSPTALQASEIHP